VPFTVDVLCDVQVYPELDWVLQHIGGCWWEKCKNRFMDLWGAGSMVMGYRYAGVSHLAYDGIQGGGTEKIPVVILALSPDDERLFLPVLPAAMIPTVTSRRLGDANIQGK